MTKSRALLAAGLVLLLLAGTYWFVNSRQLASLDRDLAKSQTQVSPSATPEDLLEAPGRLVSVITTASKRPPLFSAAFEQRQSAARAALAASPQGMAVWLKSRRDSAWAQLAPGGSIRSKVIDADFSGTLKTLAALGNTGLAAQGSFAQAAVDAHLDPAEANGLPDLAAEVRKTGELVNKVASVGRAVSPARAESRRTVQVGLRQIDAANRKIDELAPIPVLRSAVSDWQSAMNTILAATRPLHSLPAFRDRDQVALADALVAQDKESITRILEQIGPRVDDAWRKLETAERQESTAGGSLVRGLQRFARDTSQQAANSRIGKELSVTFKTLVLGTKAFYDLMEMGPNDDVFAWASRYEGDMNQLMSETDDMLATDGWSLTGKNTLVETFVNRAYADSFGHGPMPARRGNSSRTRNAQEALADKGAPLAFAATQTGNLELPDGVAPASSAEGSDEPRTEQERVIRPDSLTVLVGASARCVDLSSQADGADSKFFSPAAAFTVAGQGRLYFHAAPSEDCVSADVFVIPGDSLTAYRNLEGWYDVAYLNQKTGKTFSGWVRSERLKFTGTEGHQDKQEVSYSGAANASSSGKEELLVTVEFGHPQTAHTSVDGHDVRVVFDGKNLESITWDGRAFELYDAPHGPGRNDISTWSGGTEENFSSSMADGSNRPFLCTVKALSVVPGRSVDLQIVLSPR